MDRYIIINGTPYICHEYDMDSFIEEYKKAKANSKSNKELHREVQVITNMYTNEQITVEAYENTTGPIYVYNFNMDGIYFKQNFSTIWKDKNGTEWVEYGGLFYLVCRDQKLIDKFESTFKKNDEKSITNNDSDRIAIFRNIYSGATTRVHFKEYKGPDHVKIYYPNKTTGSLEYLNVMPRFIGKEEDCDDDEWAYVNGTWYLILKDIENHKPQIISNEPSNPDPVANHVYTIPMISIYSNMVKWMHALDPINPSTCHPVHEIYISYITSLLYKTMVQTAKSFTVSNDSGDKFYYYDCTQRNLTELLYKFVYKTSGLKDLFGNLNVSYNEMRKGVHYTDPDREKISFTSRYNSPDWRNDFIDLDALINNVVRDCIRESREAE